jgi:phosphatidylethanolamine/phosphatidyl-N-methylethanolamine N-methyltransferase
LSGTGLSRFLINAIAHPLRTGAIAPSSKALGRAMATELNVVGSGRFLELGPGTGALTSALIARGIEPSRITAIEFDSHFAALIASRFPGIDIVRGSAFDLDVALGGRNTKFAGAISGLPLRYFTTAQCSALLAAVLAHLEPGAPFVQFSYGLRAPATAPAGASVRRTAVVWHNLPPARVWVYRKG